MKQLLLLMLLFAVTAAAETNKPVRLRLDLQDGSRVYGESLLAALPVETSFGKTKIPLEQLVAVRFSDNGTNTALSLRNGDKLTGVLGLDRWDVSTVFGAIVVRRELIRAITVGRAGVLPGLLLCFGFDEKADTVTDASTHQHTGTVDRATWIADGHRGGAYRFAEGDQAIRVPNHPHWDFGQKPFTIALWVRVDAKPGAEGRGDPVMVGHNEGPGGKAKWCFLFQPDSLCFHINGPHSGAHWLARSRFTPELNRWYHLAVTREGRIYKIFVDGECVRTEQNDTAVPTADAELTIGQAEGLGIRGALDEVMIFDRALTAEEMSALAVAQ